MLQYIRQLFYKSINRMGNACKLQDGVNNEKMRFKTLKTPQAQSCLTSTYKFNGTTQFNCEESKHCWCSQSIHYFIYTMGEVSGILSTK